MKLTDALTRGSIAVCGILFGAAFALIQMLIGGTRLLFSLPAYGLLGVMSVFALVLQVLGAICIKKIVDIKV